MVGAELANTLQFTRNCPVTFVADSVSGWNFPSLCTKEICKQIADATHEYAVLIFKTTGVDDERHTVLPKDFGKLDSMPQFMKPRGRR